MSTDYEIQTEQAAFNTGYKAYGPSNGPKWAKAGAYANSLTGAAHGTPAAVQAYIDGWNSAKAAAYTPPLTYWQKELSNVITAGDNPKLKITGAINGTKWLDLTPAQFEALEAFLLTIEDTED